ncbi:Disco-interacting protein 2 -like protein C [Trichinella nelsoni]|uniref:Disco-interacting protein 2-like protein C n=1 Tax=Trichinella nelsoni TaxID=6336 RepID=A0A0V0S4H2_9BILA|nr:Disco-interacting protein 2 -like protein C [Trichinella nelsoni]
MASVDYSLLPREAREQLAQLDLELSEGDLTRKGYEKKKNNLLSQFDLSATPGKASPTTRAQRRRHRRVTRDESRFHSEIRIEAVQQALARYAQREQKGPSVPVPVKRVSQAQRNLLTKNTPLSDSSSEDDSLVSSGGDSVNLKATPNSIFHVPAFGPTAGDKVTSSLLNDFAKGLAFSSENGSSRPPPPDVTTDAQAALLVKNNADRQEDHQQSSVRVANASNKNRLSTVSILDKTDGQADYQNADLGIKSSKVSQKIQLLLSTLQKPKKKPLHEYYNDDDVELEAMAKMIDPSAPKPEGAIIYPATGESVRVAPTFPRSLTSALQRYGVSNAKSLVGTVLDHAGRAAGTLTYGKLLSRSTKLAYLLSNKMINKVEPLLKPGDRVALVYPNNDPLGFMVAFYGCLLARIIPVLIEVPISKRDGGIQQVGFLLGSCSVQVALTSESCYKGLPKSPNGDVIDFKAWPKLTWLITDHLSKAPKDWFPTLMCDDERIAYIEYTTDKEGSVKGVSVSFASLTAHSKALTAACQYKEGETMVCVLDFKREVGLWHAIQTSVFNAMHVIFVPYSLMKVNPAVWLQMITKCKASIALAKSRDLHWGLLAARDCKDVNLSSLRILLVADGSNPWSLTSCDQFVNVFKSRGLQNNVLCPCASSSETLTVAIRRGGQTNSNSIRGTLSMSALSFGVVRVDQDSSLTSLTLQDSGQGGLVFVCGIKNGLMCVSGRYHNVDDIIATVLAVEPMKFVYRGRIAVFSVKVLRDERICIIAEQRAGVYEEDSFQWMSRVLQAIDTIHMVGVYCLALVPPNGLTKTPLGGIHVSETRQKFLDGTLNFSNLLMCPHTCVTNLPKPREPQPDVGPAAVFVGNIVQGARIAVAQGRDLGPVDEDQRVVTVRQGIACEFQGAEVTSLTCANLMRRADRIGCLLLEKGRLNVGDHVALIFAPGIELICAFYGCLVVGMLQSISEEEEDDDDDNDNVEAVQNKNGSRMVPVCIRPPHPQNLQSTLPTVKMVVDVSRSVAILSTASIIKLLRSKEANSRVDAKAWPTILDAEEPCRRKHVDQYRPHSPNSTCYLDFSVSTTGMLAGIKMSHLGISAQCRSLKMACELYPSRHVCLCLDPYCGLGFVLWCISSIHSGHHSILIPPSEIDLNPSVWLSSVSHFKVRDTFCSYGVVELCVRDLASQVTQLKERGVQLSCVRTCVIVAEERPRVQLCAAFAKLFSSLGLPQRAVSTSFGCRVNVAICMQGASSPDPSTVYVDMKALRNDRVTLVEKGSPHSLPVMESGKLLPGVKVVIANPDTCGQLADSHLGEIWVQSMHNASGYFTIHGEESSIHNSHFNAHLSTGDTLSNFARTGYVGFLRRTQAVTADGGKSNILTMRFLLLVLWTKR